MSGNGKFTVKQVIKAIHATHGIKMAAARRLGCNRQTIYNYAKKYPTVQAACDEAAEEFLDLAESRLHEAVDRGMWPAIAFTLRTVGARRGYLERQQIEQVGDMTVNLSWGDNDDNN